MQRKVFAIRQTIKINAFYICVIDDYYYYYYFICYFLYDNINYKCIQNKNHFFSNTYITDKFIRKSLN